MHHEDIVFVVIDSFIYLSVLADSSLQMTNLRDMYG